VLSRKRRAGLSVGWLLASPLALLLFTLAIGVAITHRHADFSAATSGGAAWAAFAFFGKRRRGRDESEPDQLLADSAATGVDTDAALGLQLVDESQMPRWRRPSLQQVRKSDPLRAAAEASTMSFARAGVRPLDSYERRHLRYRLVRLLDSPDEVRASEIGILDRGDEVMLLERHGVYWRVLCPDGRTGWVHRMTLNDPVLSPAAAGGARPAGPPAPATGSGTAEMPAGASDRDVDGLLEAYLRARSDVRSVDEREPVEPLPSAEPAVSLARDYLERAGFVVQRPEPRTKPARRRLARAATEPAVAASPEPVAKLAARPIIVPSAEPTAVPAAKPITVPSAESTAVPAAKPIATPARKPQATTAPVDPPSSDAAPAAEPERAGGRYSGRKSGGSRKAATESRPGTKSRRPSR
jgi:hypothetical protein